MVNYCKTCGEPLSREVKFGDKIINLPLACKCQREEREQLEQQIARVKALLRNADIICEGYLEQYYLDMTFDKDDSTETKVSADMRRYVDKWDMVKENNLGLLLMGNYGTGKTFYASCIANAVRKKGEFVLIGTVSKLIRLMNDGFGKDRDEWESKIQSYPLMVLDDIGTERDTEYNYEQIENIIDLRYQAKKPLIVTTNLTTDAIKELASSNDIRKGRAWSRIRELCTTYVITGEDRRKTTAKEKRDAVKELFE